MTKPHDRKTLVVPFVLRVSVYLQGQNTRTCIEILAVEFRYSDGRAKVGSSMKRFNVNMFFLQV
jgi:hypothetical protein